MTPGQAAAKIARMVERMPVELRRAEEKTVKQGLRIARKWSSGTYSLLALAKAGHPYSRRRPNSAFDPGLINVQSGDFRRASFNRTRVELKLLQHQLAACARALLLIEPEWN